LTVQQKRIHGLRLFVGTFLYKKAGKY